MIPPVFAGAGGDAAQNQDLRTARGVVCATRPAAKMIVTPHRTSAGVLKLIAKLARSSIFFVRTSSGCRKIATGLTGIIFGEQKAHSDFANYTPAPYTCTQTMFERSTEKRVILYPRYMAYTGSSKIEIEHVRLGLLRGGYVPGLRISRSAMCDGTSLGRTVEHMKPVRPPIPARVDLPLSPEGKQ